MTSLVLGGCLSACRFDSSPLGGPPAPVGIAGAQSPAIAGSGGTGAAGMSSSAVAALSGAGTMSSAIADPAGAGSTGAAATPAPGPADAGAASSGEPDADATNGEPAANSGSAGAGGVTAPPVLATGTLPAITDPAIPGGFTIRRTNNAGPLGSYTLFEPVELGKDGLLHPVLVWGPGAGANPDIYLQLLEHVTTHGFVVISYNSTPQGPELTRAIDWIIERATTAGSPYFEKLDTTKIAIGGQSAGSLATFASGKDERITTTIHINGGTFIREAAKNLIKPAFFVCGDDPAMTGGDGTWQSDLARPNCDADFMNATVPVWYGVVIGSSHTTVIDNPIDMTVSPLKVHYLASMVAWLRWQLAGDFTMKALFVGPDCGYCKQTAVWEVKQKDLM